MQIWKARVFVDGQEILSIPAVIAETQRDAANFVFESSVPKEVAACEILVEPALTDGAFTEEELGNA